MSKHDSETIVTAVKEHYGAFARSKLGEPQADAGCCGTDAAGEPCCTTAYDKESMAGLDPDLATHSQGCGNPIAIAELKPGETVLDLGSGAGLDCFLSAKQVGPTGSVIGVDMTADMLALAKKNQVKLGMNNVEFREGKMESLPVDDGIVDTVISNCVINLSSDKQAVLSEAFRVLKPGGKLRVSDIVWHREPTQEEQADLASWTECVAGALTVNDFKAQLSEAGFTEIRIDAPPAGATPWVSALIYAERP